MTKHVAIVGAGPAGLMAAEQLSLKGIQVSVYEQMPTAARKFLMAGKTGLNISHREALPEFIQRYDRPEWLAPCLEIIHADWIMEWMTSLGIDSYIGSSGRIFPVEMKAAPLLRAWLARLQQQGVKIFYRHQCVGLQGQTLSLLDKKQERTFEQSFDAVILACGAVSWPQLGSDGAWQRFLARNEIEAFQPSNAGVLKSWSHFMQPMFGQVLKRVHAWVDGHQDKAAQGDIVISHYGLESGLIYKWGRALRQHAILMLDLLPQHDEVVLQQKLQPSKKQSLANVWRKAGLDAVKAAVLRELIDRRHWHDAAYMAHAIKHLKISIEGFRPIEEAISCSGGVKPTALSDQFQLKQHAGVFCCGEMLDWDAPTGGYLLTACFATGYAAAHGVYHYVVEADESATQSLM